MTEIPPDAATAARAVDAPTDATRPETVPIDAGWHEGKPRYSSAGGFLGTPLHDLQQAFADAETAFACACARIDTALRRAIRPDLVAALPGVANRESRLRALGSPTVARRLARLRPRPAERQALADGAAAFEAAAAEFERDLQAISMELTAGFPRWWPRTVGTYGLRPALEALSRRLYLQRVNPTWRRAPPEVNKRKTGFHLLHLRDTTELGTQMIERLTPVPRDWWKVGTTSRKNGRKGNRIFARGRREAARHADPFAAPAAPATGGGGTAANPAQCGPDQTTC